MNRAQLKQYILETYNCEADHPWMNFPGNEVFRHSNNRKWFALIMDVPRERLGLAGTEPLDVVNLKCDPILIGSFRREIGIFPAYHMSKANWITTKFATVLMTVSIIPAPMTVAIVRRAV